MQSNNKNNGLLKSETNKLDQTLQVGMEHSSGQRRQPSRDTMGCEERRRLQILFQEQTKSLRRVYRKLKDLEAERVKFLKLIRCQEEALERSLQREEQLKEELECCSRRYLNSEQKVDSSVTFSDELCSTSQNSNSEQILDPSGSYLYGQCSTRRNSNTEHIVDPSGSFCDGPCCRKQNMDNGMDSSFTFSDEPILDDVFDAEHADSCGVQTALLKQIYFYKMRIEALDDEVAKESEEKYRKLSAASDEIRDLEVTLDREKSNAVKWSNLSKELQEELKNTVDDHRSKLEEKFAIIEDLSNKLQSSTEENEKLKRQTATSEDTYRTYHKGLQSLVCCYLHPDVDIPKPKRGDQPMSVCELLDAVTESMALSQSQISRMEQEMDTIQREYEQKADEVETYNEGKSYLNRKLKDCHNQLNSHSEELERLLEQQKKSVARIKLMKDGWDEDKKLLEQCRQEEKRFKKKMEDELERRRKFLCRTLYYLANGAEVEDTPEFDKFTFEELCDAIQEHIGTLFEELIENKEKSSKYQLKYKETTNALRNLELTHADTVKRMICEMQEQEDSCKKKGLEQHTCPLLKESKARAEGCREILDKTKEKMATHERAKCVDPCEKSSLLLACALLAGGLYPLYSRTCALSVQRDLLLQQLDRHEVVEKKIKSMTEAFYKGNEQFMCGSDKKKKKGKSMIHVFRKSVIAVIAAKRLQRLGQLGNSLFNWAEGCKEGTGILVIAGTTSMFSGQNDQKRCHELVNWFKNPDLHNSVVSSVTELQKVLFAADTTCRTSGHLIINAARSAFSKFMEKLSINMTNVPVSRSVFRNALSRDSLLQSLARGLQRCDSLAQAGGLWIDRPLMKYLVDLQEEVKQFTHRLKNYAEERQDMSLQIEALKSELFKSLGDSEALQQKIQELTHGGSSHGVPTTEPEQSQKDEQVCQLSRQLSQQKENQLRLEETINELEQTLRLSAKERLALTNSMNYVKNIFEKVRQEILQQRKVERNLPTVTRRPKSPGSRPQSPPVRHSLPVVLPKLDFSKFPDLGTDMPDHKAMKKLVDCFIDVYNLINMKPSAGKEAIESERACLQAQKSRINAHLAATTAACKDIRKNAVPAVDDVFTFDDKSVRDYLQNRSSDCGGIFHDSYDEDYTSTTEGIRRPYYDDGVCSTNTPTDEGNSTFDADIGGKHTYHDDKSRNRTYDEGEEGSSTYDCGEEHSLTFDTDKQDDSEFCYDADEVISKIIELA
ncbi:coiled-coil domain-containing protein 171-like [Ambystoma mexicanum]|uniref:coiled-coil domain-containing protein 171-like n=1 Tax=Ambystoma mexicanum TaxID=8296 RepID=UPI0037E81E30